METLDYVGSKRILNLVVETNNAGPEEAHQVQTNVEYSSSLSFSGIKVSEYSSEDREWGISLEMDSKSGLSSRLYSRIRRD